MSRTIKIVSLILIFFVITTYSPNQESIRSSFFYPIKKINIEGNQAIDDKTIITKLEKVKGSSLLFLNNKEIGNILEKFEFISSYKFKKIYPDNIVIIIYEKKPIAIFFNGKKNFYLTEKGELINYSKLDIFKNLPILIGKKKNFHEFYKILKSVDFPIDQVNSFNYFNIDRWDIILKNKKVIKLPNKDYINALNNFIKISKNKSFDKYKVFDYRIIDQLILN